MLTSLKSLTAVTVARLPASQTSALSRSGYAQAPLTQVVPEQQPGCRNPPHFAPLLPQHFPPEEPLSWQQCPPAKQMLTV